MREKQGEAPAGSLAAQNSNGGHFFSKAETSGTTFTPVWEERVIRGLSPSISRYELTGAPYTILIAILCSSQNQNFLKSVCIIKGKKNNKRQPKEHEMRF